MGPLLDLTPFPTGKKQEDGGEGKRSWCSLQGMQDPCGILSLAEGIHWGTGPPASSQPTCLSLGSSLRQVIWKPLGWDAGCPFCCAPGTFIYMGGPSPLQRQSHRLLSEKYLLVGWDCSQRWWSRNASVLSPCCPLEAGEKRDRGKSKRSKSFASLNGRVSVFPSQQSSKEIANYLRQGKVCIPVQKIF